MLITTPPPPWRHHLARRGLAAEEDGFHIGADDAVEVFLRHIEEFGAMGDAGIGEHDVDAAMALDRACHEGVDIALQPGIAANERSAQARRRRRARPSH